MKGKRIFYWKWNVIRNWFRNDNKNNSKSKSSYFSGAGVTQDLKEKIRNIPVKVFNMDKKDDN